MTAASTVAAMTLTAGEVSAAHTAAGYEDAVGMLSSINNDMAHLRAKMTALATAIGAGTNATALGALVTAMT